MPQTIIVYQSKTPVLIYTSPSDELLVVVLPDESKGSIKSAISKILNIPKKFISVKGNNAYSDEYSRQMDFTIGHIKNT